MAQTCIGILSTSPHLVAQNGQSEGKDKSLEAAGEFTQHCPLISNRIIIHTRGRAKTKERERKELQMQKSVLSSLTVRVHEGVKEARFVLIR